MKDVGRDKGYLDGTLNKYINSFYYSLYHIYVIDTFLYVFFNTVKCFMIFKGG